MTITINGELLIGGSAVKGSAAAFRAVNPATGEQIASAFGTGTADDVERACALADAAFDTYRETSLEARAAFLELAAQNILDLGPQLIERAMLESGLPQARLEGERGRTVNQLRLFAKVVRDGRFLAAALEPVLERKAGRVLVNGYPTGVEVSHAMVHGGPFPATSDSRSTSVGAGAIDRFLRPVSYQDFPAWLLPEALQDANPHGLHRIRDGELVKG